MGCFDVVCSLTNVPIRTREKCHIVVLRKDVSWDTVTWLLSSEGRIGVETIFHGEYNDYGSIDEPEGELSKAEMDLLETFNNHMSGNERKYFYVCDTAYQWAMEKYKNYIPFEVENRRRELQERLNMGLKPSIFMEIDAKLEAKQIEIGRLTKAFSDSCKHPLSGLGLYHQYGGEEIEGIKANIELTQKRLAELEKYYADIRAENGEDEEEEIAPKTKRISKRKKK